MSFPNQSFNSISNFTCFVEKQIINKCYQLCMYSQCIFFNSRTSNTFFYKFPASASGLQIQDPPPLSCQKWWLSGQQRHAVSHVSVAMGELCPFDRILQYSMDPSMGELKGLVTQYVTLGEKPFMSFYYAAEVCYI